jgi:photosystem II stability/assembly factor-like uncharacterized protein
MSRYQRISLVLFIALASVFSLAQWRQLGPDGGDVRSLAYDPHTPGRILLGTSAGELFQSTDGGGSWERLAHLGKGNDYVLDDIIFDPAKPELVYLGAWSVENNGGDIFRSTDGGRTWNTMPAMHGKSIRALGMAASNSELLVAGALDGIYRTRDGGQNWERISPEGHSELRNFESIAVDPQNPQVIYAGTWHLPWKTDDGGEHWHNIKSGLIDDSDIFSIIIDPKQPSVVYTSACSGIYKSENGGELYHKVQGMPFSARRTRVLKQDPVDGSIVYAGTTEGLWKSVNAGASWARVTPANVIVNDVMIDPAQHQRVMLATDRGGILASDNGFQTFYTSNRGFSHRQVAALLTDRVNPEIIYTGVVNDKEYGGVFVTRDGGNKWEQMSTGLAGRDVFTLAEAPSGKLLAGTNSGLFVADPERGALWTPINSIVNTEKLTRTVKVGKKKVPKTITKVKTDKLTSRVNDLELTASKWYAATTNGLFTSTDDGKSWQGGDVLGQTDFVAVHTRGTLTAAAARTKLLVSLDKGDSWFEAKTPREISGITDVAIDSKSQIYLATREGAYRSDNGGDSWTFLDYLPVNNLASIVYDEEGQRLLATSYYSTQIFESLDSGCHWRGAQAGWWLRGVRPVHGRIIAATAFSGLVEQPQNSAAMPSAGGSQP